MGTVWRATDLVLDREVAIKMAALRSTDDPDWSARFRREARMLARLSHPPSAAYTITARTMAGLLL